jgi:hypothetical protein
MHTPAYLLAINHSKVVYLIASTISHTVDSLLWKSTAFLASQILHETACQIIVSPFNLFLQLKGKPKVSKEVDKFPGRAVCKPNHLYISIHTAATFEHVTNKCNYVSWCDEQKEQQISRVAGSADLRIRFVRVGSLWRISCQLNMVIFKYYIKLVVTNVRWSLSLENWKITTNYLISLKVNHTRKHTLPKMVSREQYMSRNKYAIVHSSLKIEKSFLQLSFMIKIETRST